MTNFRRGRGWGSKPPDVKPPLSIDEVLARVRAYYIEVESQKTGPKKVTVAELDQIMERAKTP